MYDALFMTILFAAMFIGTGLLIGGLEYLDRKGI
ncbi:MAG: hypothetical protein K0R28_3596 [Paenibacillus sp.]|nr:hypothetical protein [Paenibacillus sp.]